MENHTFDNLLGSWCNQTRKCDGIPSSVKLSDGSVATPTVAPDIVPNVDHSVAAQKLAMNCVKGSPCAMNGWELITNGCASPAYGCISYYPTSVQPNLTALANAYAVATRAFTQQNAPSWTGHMDLVAATADGFQGDLPYPPYKGAPNPAPGWGCDSWKTAPYLPVNGKPVPQQPSCVPDYQLSRPNGGAFEPTIAPQVPTIMNEMDAAKPAVSWRIYGTAPYGTPKFFGLGYIWDTCPTFASCLYTQQINNVYDAGQFFTDTAQGNLPQVTFLMPAGTQGQYSGHNQFSNAAADNWVGKVVSTVQSSPLWSSTAIIIHWDDCGCFYDHVPPPIGPDGRQMGARVPFLVVSPWAKTGVVDSTPMTDTGSILKFIELTFNLPSMNVNDGNSYNLSGMFNFAMPPRLKRVHTVWRPLSAKQLTVTPAMLQDTSGT
jgi:Phosphoesterase family